MSNSPGSAPTTCVCATASSFGTICQRCNRPFASLGISTLGPSAGSFTIDGANNEEGVFTAEAPDYVLDDPEELQTPTIFDTIMRRRPTAWELGVPTWLYNSFSKDGVWGFVFALKAAVRRKHEELKNKEQRIAELEARLAEETHARREAERSRP